VLKGERGGASNSPATAIPIPKRARRRRDPVIRFIVDGRPLIEPPTLPEALAEEKLPGYGPISALANGTGALPSTR